MPVPDRVEEILFVLNEFQKGNFNIPVRYGNRDGFDIILQKLDELRPVFANASLRAFDEERINQVLDGIVRITTFDFSQKIRVSEKHDAIDAIALGLNMLSFELKNRLDELSMKNEELRKLAAVIDTTAEAVTTITPDGLLSSWNKSAERIYGYTAEEMIGKSPEEILMVPSERLNFRNILNRARGGEQIFDFITQRRRKDGRVIDVSITVTPIISEGKLLSLSVISRDITSELAATKLLRESEERYRLLVHSIRDYAVFTLSPEGIILNANIAAAEITGFKDEALIGQHVKVLYTPKSREKGDPERHMKYALERGFYRHIGIKMKQDGTRIWAETVCAPFFDDKGLLKGYSKVMQDITARKMAEDRMKEQQEQIETIIANAPSAVVVIDENSDIVRWNQKATEIFGWSAEEVLGHPMHKFIMPQRHVQNHYAGIKRFLKTGEGPVLNRVVEITAVRKTGEEFPIELGISAVKSRKKYLFIAFIVDITDRKKAEMELQRANVALDATNRELEAFTYSVSHDLRAPVRVIQGYTEMLAAELEKSISEDHKKLLNAVRKNTRKMAQLINDLLALSHLGQKELMREKVNMSALARTVIENMRNSEKTEGVDIVVEDLPNAEADYNLMMQVFHNLISNAVKYSSRVEKARVQIGSMKNEENQMVYFVKDNGAGFDMKYYSKLFGVFQRLHSSSEYEGTGVGLSIVKRVIEKHHGKVWAESEPGKGATFYFTLGEKQEVL